MYVSVATLLKYCVTLIDYFCNYLQKQYFYQQLYTYLHFLLISQLFEIYLETELYENGKNFIQKKIIVIFIRIVKVREPYQVSK